MRLQTLGAKEWLESCGSKTDGQKSHTGIHKE